MLNSNEIAYITSPNGMESPSPYLVHRDTFISNWQIPVDIGNNTISYRFGLNPEYLYRAKVVVYHESGGQWQGRIKVDNGLQFLVNYNAQVPEVLEFWIPSELYQDSVLNLTFERVIGGFASLGPIYIYRYENDRGGGPMSWLNQSALETHFTLAPNPFATTLNIKCQSQGKNNVSVKVYDISGRLVKELFKGTIDRGFLLRWNGEDEFGRIVSQGVYFVRIDYFDTESASVHKVVKIE